MKVENLDVLRPEPRFVQLNGNQIDVSFIPCGITFEIDQIVQELIKIKADDLENKPESMKRAFELAIELCAAFCSRKYPEMDKQWFLDNVDPAQLKSFSESIQEALFKSYTGIETSGKNLPAAKRKKSQ
jgi:hypothetical protein